MAVNLGEPEGDERKYEFVMLELLNKVLLVLNVYLVQNDLVVVVELVLLILPAHELIVCVVMPEADHLVLKLDYLFNEVEKLLRLLLIDQCVL